MFQLLTGRSLHRNASPPPKYWQGSRKVPREAQFQPSTLQINSELLQECCQTAKRFSTLSHSKHHLPRIVAGESQILLLNSDYSTKSKNLKTHRLPSQQHHSSIKPQGKMVCLQGEMKWECCNTLRTLKGSAPHPCLATLSPPSLVKPHFFDKDTPAQPQTDNH